MATNIGLYTGTTGSLLITLLQNSYQGAKDCVNPSLLLEHIWQNIQSENLLSFDCGIPGIGWVLEWCNQNQLLDINSDEVLSDIDDFLYRKTVYGSIQQLPLMDLIGVSNYFYIRALSLNKGQSRYRHICHRECLLLVLEDIDAKYKIEIGKNKRLNRGEYFQFLPVYLLLLYRLLVLNIPSIKQDFSRVLCESIEVTLDFCNKRLTPEIDKSLLYYTALLYGVLLIVSKKHKIIIDEHNAQYQQLYNLGNIIKQKILPKITSKIDLIVLLALYQISTHDSQTDSDLQGLITEISCNHSFDSLPDTFSGGKGILEVIRFWLYFKQRKDITDFLLLHASIT